MKLKLQSGLKREHPTNASDQSKCQCCTYFLHLSDELIQQNFVLSAFQGMGRTHFKLSKTPQCKLSQNVELTQTYQCTLSNMCPKHRVETFCLALISS